MVISILQIDNPHADYVYMDSDFAIKHNFNILHYKMVYTYKKIDNVWLDDQDTLNEVFNIFNCNQPDDFGGRSISVSDIIMIDNRMYYVEPVGFTRVI